MNRVIRWTCRGAYGLFVAFALSFGATQAFATTTLAECPSSGFIGFCPPYEDWSCADDCQGLGHQDGACLGECCICFI